MEIEYFVNMLLNFAKEATSYAEKKSFATQAYGAVTYACANIELDEGIERAQEIMEFWRKKEKEFDSLCGLEY